MSQTTTDLVLARLDRGLRECAEEYGIEGAVAFLSATLSRQGYARQATDQENEFVWLKRGTGSRPDWRLKVTFGSSEEVEVTP